MNDHAPTLLSVQQASARLSVSETTVLRLIARGDLRAVRIGKQWRIPSEDVERMACPTATAPVPADPGSAAGDKTTGRASPPGRSVAVRTAPTAEPGVKLFRVRPWEATATKKAAPARG